MDMLPTALNRAFWVCFGIHGGTASRRDAGGGRRGSEGQRKAKIKRPNPTKKLTPQTGANHLTGGQSEVPHQFRRWEAIRFPEPPREHDLPQGRGTTNEVGSNIQRQGRESANEQPSEGHFKPTTNGLFAGNINLKWSVRRDGQLFRNTAGSP